MITETSVLRWAIANPTSPPQKVFDCHATFKVKGAIQLYSRDRGVSRPIKGHTAAFAEIGQEGRLAIYVRRAHYGWCQGSFPDVGTFELS